MRTLKQASESGVVGGNPSQSTVACVRRCMATEPAAGSRPTLRSCPSLLVPADAAAAAVLSVR